MRSKITENTYSRYVTFMRWLLPDALLRWKRRTASVLLAGFVGVTFQIAVFALIIYYAQQFSRGNRIDLAGFSFDPRSSLVLLALGSLVAAMLLLLSSLSVYQFRKGIIKLGRTYEEFCAKRVLGLLGSIDLLPVGSDSPVNSDSYLFRLVKSDSRFAGRVLRSLLSMVVPVLSFLFALVVSLYLAPGLSLLVALMAGVLLYYQLKVSRDAAGHSVRFEDLGADASREFRELIENLKHQMIANEGNDKIDRIFSGGPIKGQLDAYEGRLLSIENSRFISSVFMAVILGLIMLVMGGGIIREGTNWGVLLVYVVILRYGLVNLQTIFSLITSINRFYPQVRRYFLFIRAAGNLEQMPAADPAHSIRVAAEPDALFFNDQQDELTVDRGLRFAVITPFALNRYTLGSVLASISNENVTVLNAILAKSRVISAQHSCPRGPLNAVLGLGPDGDLSRLRNWIADETFWGQTQAALPPNLQAAIKERDWNNLDPALKVLMSLVSAKNSDAVWIFVDADGINGLEQNKLSDWPAEFTDRILVFVYNKHLGKIGTNGEQYVVIANERTTLGIGDLDWLTLLLQAQNNTLIGLTTPKKPDIESSVSAGDLED